MKKEFKGLSEKIRDGQLYTFIDVEDIKEAVKKLKEGCFICGKKIVKGQRARPNKSQLCNSCYFRMHTSPVKSRELLFKKIDKIFGDKLVKK